MWLELNIARRLSSRKGGARAGVMERVAVVATAVSLAVIVVTLAVVVGFKRDLGHLLSGAVADVVITSPHSRGTLSAEGIERSEALEALFADERIDHYAVYTAKEGVIKSDDNIVGVILKGVEQGYDLRLYADHIVEGELPRIGCEPRTRDILLSEVVAKKMDAEVGDRVEMVFIDGGGQMIRDRYSIVGIYRTGVEMIDNSFAITDIGNVERLYNDFEGLVTGYELRLKEGVDNQLVADELNERLIELYYAEGIDGEAFTLGDIFPTVYFWLATHDLNALIVIVIMIVVALLNMTTALLIIVLERQRMIGELRALGMSGWRVVRLFLFRSLFIVGRGVVWGTAVGIALCAIQHHFAVVPLPAEGYLLSAVPAAMCWAWWALAVVGSVAVATVVMLLPAAFAAKISPSETMRYE